MPAQRPDEPTSRHVPNLERVVPRPGHDAVVRQGGDTPDLRPSRRRRAIGSTGRRRRAESVCPRSVRTSRPLDTSHTLSVRSPDPETTRPSGRAATHQTCAPRGVDERSTHGSTGRRPRAAPLCPRNVWRQAPVDTSHTMSVRSPDPETTRPSGRAATHKSCAPDCCSDALFDRTQARALFVWPRSVATHR